MTILRRVNLGYELGKKSLKKRKHPLKVQFPVTQIKTTPVVKLAISRQRHNKKTDAIALVTSSSGQYFILVTKTSVGSQL